ncbi:hypothetical protein [Bryobacter aggregatus]|uniref:hypothetical protein n=1 Tax=Bryobacter aggregatus TaxID=360054 RepID=UPI00056602F3|nr:hypothetical protein [Bryobacter aggregatus]
MIIAIAIGLTVLVIALTLFIREADLPQLPPENPFKIFDERKARIYENLRDLQFELRLGKLSDDDYAKSKASLQHELAQVLAEADALKATLGVASK